MSIERTSWITAGMTVLFGASAYAGYPESCFQSKNDYEIYVKYGKEGPPEPDQTMDDHDEYYRLADLHIYGPGRMKAITISVKQTQASSGARIVSDASGSTTPSGKKVFAWGSSDIVSTTAEYSVNAGSPGSYRNIQLKVSDPVCGLESSTQVRVTSK